MKPTLFGTVVALLACSACGGKSPSIDVPVAQMPPAAVDDHVVFADSARARAVLLDVSGTSALASPTVVPLVPHPTHTEQRRGHTDELLVLSAGQPDDGTATPARPGLVVVGANGKTREYRYDSAFDAVAQSDDGSYAVLFFDQAAAQQADTLLFNPNEIAIVDLTKDASSNAPAPNPHVRTLRSFGSAPQSVAFTKMTLNGDATPRDLAVVLLDSYLAIIDLSHLDRPEYTIGLAKPGANDIHLSKVIFSTTTNKIYLEASGSNDIYVVKLSDGGSATVGDGGVNLNDFTPSLNQLAAGVGPTDMALYTLPGTTVEKLVVAAPGSSQVVIIEPNTSNVTTVQLPSPASQVLLFNEPSPKDATSSPRALLYTPGVTAVAFLDLVTVEKLPAQSLDFLSVPQPYSSALPLDPNTVMLIHQTTGLSLLNLTDRTVAQIQGPNLASAASDPADQKLWLYTNDTVGFLDLKNGVHPNQVRVDAPVQALVTVPSKTRPTVVVTHPSSMGWATVLDAADPTNLGKAYSMRGFMFSGLLQGGGQ